MPLKYKITIIFGLIFAFTFLGIYSYLNSNITDHLYSRIKEKLFNEVNLAKTHLEELYHSGMSIDEIDSIVDNIGLDLKLRVTFIDINGKVMGDSDLDGESLYSVENHLYRPEVQEALKQGMGESERFSTTIQQNMIYLSKKLNRKNLQGVIRIAIPLEDIDMISNQLRNVLFISLFIALILAVGSSFLASIFISKPIQEVSETSRKIAAGDFSKKLIVYSKDEIGHLAESFNFMSDQIRNRIHDYQVNKARLEAVLLSMVEGVMAVDLNSEIILMNQTLKDFFQVKEEVVGKRPIEVVRNIEIQEIVDKALKSKDRVESYEVTMLLPEERIVLIHATSLIQDNYTEGVVLVFHDITDLRKLENIRRDFVANVSHELRTPVTSIKGYAETLINGAIDDKKNAADFLRIIYKDADRLAKLVDDLLDLSKIESGKTNLQMKAISIKPLLERIISSLKIQLEDKKIVLDINLPRRMPKVMADDASIGQVFLNLIDNAIKYNKSNGQIKIYCEDDEKFVRFFVEDTGIGIPAEDIERIFERFYRVDKAHSRELGGTGLGLSIVKHIIHLQNGEVFAESVLGKGSIFSFTLQKA